MQYSVNINWNRDTADFNVKTFSRTHQLEFGGGESISASSAPEFAGIAELPNPEELFAASITSCLMLTFLYLAAMKNIVINSYNAVTVGTLAKNSEGKMAMTEIVIQPTLTFENQQPDQAILDDLFKKAHDTCFISNSVKTKVTIDQRSLATQS